MAKQRRRDMGTHPSDAWRITTPAAPPVDTEAAEVWRGLNKPRRDVLRAACAGVVRPELTITRQCCNALLDLLLVHRGREGGFVATEFGHRVDAYGRAQAEVTRG